MTVNIVSQLSIQPTTTFRDLFRTLTTDGPRAGTALVYSQQVDDTHWLQGELGDLHGNEPFARGAVARLGGAHWRTLVDEFNPFTDEATALDTPDWAASVRDHLLAQRGGFAALKPQLELLHAARTERFRDQEWFSAFPPRIERAWRDLPVLDYLEATGLRPGATFTLVPAHLVRMAASPRVRRD